MALTAVLFLRTGCFGRSASDEEQEIEASAEEEQEEYEQAFDGDYPGTVAAREAASDEAPYYGIMYATILDINGSGINKIKAGSHLIVVLLKDRLLLQHSSVNRSQNICYIPKRLLLFCSQLVQQHIILLRKQESPYFRDKNRAYQSRAFPVYLIVSLDQSSSCLPEDS